MIFSEIKPFIRFARRLVINDETVFPKSLPIDARLFYTYSGEGHIEIEDNIYKMEVGTILFINSGVPYRLHTSNVTYIALNFDFTNNFSHLETPIPPVNLKLFNNEKILENCIFTDTHCFNKFYYFKECNYLQKKLEKIEAEFIRKIPFHKIETSSILTSVLVSLAREAEKRPSKETKFDIEKIVKYIQLNYNKEIDNITLSKEFNFHPNYISSEFKRITGKPLHKYVLDTRIFNAISLMESGNKNITEIAELSGFNDSNYFTRYFKLSVGISPGKYIKSCSEKNII